MSVARSKACWTSEDDHHLFKCFSVLITVYISFGPHSCEGCDLDHHTPGRFRPWSQRAKSSAWLLAGPKRAWPDKMTVTYSNRLQQCIQKRCTRILDPIVKERSAWTTIQSADVNCRIKKPSPCYELSLRFKACLTSPEDQHLFKTATAMWQKQCTSTLCPLQRRVRPWPPYIWTIYTL